MADPVAVYGAVAGSAGLLGLGWQVYTRYLDERDRVSFDVEHLSRELRPEDPGYDIAFQKKKNYLESQEGLPNAVKNLRLKHIAEPGTSIAVTNLSHHPVRIIGAGMIQDETQGDCTMICQEDVQPRTTYREFWIPDWWSENEEDGGMDLRRFPIRAYVQLDHGPIIYSGALYVHPRPHKPVKRPRGSLDIGSDR